MPCHGRAFLAERHPAGFVAPSAALSHPDIRFGQHVYVGDNVIAFADKGAGPVFLDDHVQLYGDTLLRNGLGAVIRIRKSAHIQQHCYIVAMHSDIVIGESVEMAAGCALYSSNHGIEPGKLIMGQPLTSKGPVVVGDGAWLGHGVTVLSGVRIGDGAVIGAGAVVIKDVPDNAIAVGIPSRVIGYRGDTQ